MNIGVVYYSLNDQRLNVLVDLKLAREEIWIVDRIIIIRIFMIDDVEFSNRHFTIR